MSFLDFFFGRTSSGGGAGATQAVDELAPSATPPQWIPDAVSSDCYRCNAKFTTLRRKHHCRTCGQIFCSKCCSLYIPGWHLGNAGSVRVCIYCHTYFQEQISPVMSAATSNSSSSNAAVASRQSPKEGKTSAASAASSSPISSEHRNSIIALNQPFGGEELAQDAVEALRADAASSDNFRLKDPRILHKFLDRITAAEDGIRLGTKFYRRGVYHNCFTGAELVAWIRRQDAGKTDVNLARALCQGLLDYGFIKPFVESTGDVFQVSDVPYRAMTHLARRNDNCHSSDLGSAGDEDLTFPNWLQDGEIVDEQTPVFGLERKRQGQETKKASTSSNAFDGDTKATLDALKAPLIEPPHQPKEESLSNRADQQLADSFATTYNMHIESHLKHFLSGEGLDINKWFDYVLETVQNVVRNIEPDISAEGEVEVDLKRSIKIKKLSGGTVADCAYVSGEIFSNRFPRDASLPRIEQPKLLLAGGSLKLEEYEGRYASLEALRLREEELARSVCAKVLTAAPDILLVEGSVCRLVQDVLDRRGIAFVHNVKRSVLERISKYFDVPIHDGFSGVFSSAATTPVLEGSCRLFHTVRCRLSNGQVKELLFLEGAVRRLGCTLLLRGGPSHELEAIKRVIRRLLPFQVNARYETAFLIVSYADPQVENLHPQIPIERKTLSPFVDIPEHLITESDEKESNSNVCDIDVIISKDDKKAKSSESDATSSHRLPFFKSSDCIPVIVDGSLSGDVNEEKLRQLLAHYRNEFSLRPLSGNDSEMSLSHKQPKQNCAKDNIDGSDNNSNKFIAVLFSSHCPKSRAMPYFCVKPWIVNMQYYGLNDMTLGSFLNIFCFAETYSCVNVKVCEKLMHRHVRRFCHGDASITLTVGHFQDYVYPQLDDENNTTVTWRYCPTCQLTTPARQMTYDANMISFAMFLTLSFHESRLRRRGSSATVCNHSLHRGSASSDGEGSLGHRTHFARGKTLVTFEFAPVYAHELALPPRRIWIPSPTADAERIVEESLGLAAHANIIFSAILEEMSKLKGCGVPLLEEQLDSFSAEHARMHNEYRELMSTLTATLGKEDYLQEGRSLVFKIKRHLCVTLNTWRKLLRSLQELGRKEEKSLQQHGKDQSPATVADPSNGGSKFDDILLPSSKNYETIFKSPFPPTQHYYISGTQRIVVDENQLSSLIAFSLGSPHYEAYLTGSSSYFSAVREAARKETRHFEHTFSDGTDKFFILAFFAVEFQRLRDAVIGSSDAAAFVDSLAECSPWESKGGKSKSVFYKTRDDRFILKTLNNKEADHFASFVPGYIDYVLEGMAAGRPSCLAKILGIFNVGFQTASSVKACKATLLVIENVFYGRSLREKFDLKGSIRNRLVDTTPSATAVADSNLVLWDENLLLRSCERPLYVSSGSKRTLLEAITADTHFLCQIGMMDYSLLVGLDNHRLLVVGIVDYLRVFSWDKKLEQILKSSAGILSGRGQQQPTIVSPNLYRDRFREAMYKNFILLPDFSYKDPATAVAVAEEEKVKR